MVLTRSAATQDHQEEEVSQLGVRVGKGCGGGGGMSRREQDTGGGGLVETGEAF